MTERQNTMNPQIEAVKQAIAILRAAFPKRVVTLTLWDHSAPQLAWHGNETYLNAVEWFRSLGCGTREKTPHETYTQLKGIAEGIEWITYPDELPPTCHKVKKIERVPKTQTIEAGDFIEIEREVVVCGNDPDEMPATQTNLEAASV